MVSSSTPTSSSTKDENKRKLIDELARTKKYMEITTLAKNITTAIKNCNLLFRNLTEVPIFREDIQAISVLHQPCSDENDFCVKLGALAELFQADSEKWKPILENFDPKMKRGSTLLIKWLEEQKIPYNRDTMKVWDTIITLRNVSFPYHPTNVKLIEIVKFFEQSFPMNYAEFYESILRMLLDSLEMLQRILFNETARESATF